MNKGSKRIESVLLIIFLLFVAQPVWSMDFSKWDGLLKKYVAPSTIDGVTLTGVRYPELEKDPAYHQVLKDLENASLSKLTTRNQQLAFWINTYNVLAVKMVVDHYPVKSIKDAGSLFTSVWKKEIGMVGGKTRTLDEIEHRILRTMGDPRIHAAIVCASVSCPDLRPEAYRAEDLDRQLDDQLRAFLANQKKGLRVEKGNKRVYLSSIFKWFKEDFKSKGGVLVFLAPYAPKDRQKLLLNSPKISYMDYNWRLNKL